MTVMTGRRAFLCGAIAGAGTAWVLLVSGVGQTLWPPLWQRIAFFPGLASGWTFYDCCHHWFSYSTAETVSEAVGVLAVGVTYGLVALGGYMIWSRIRNHRSAALRPASRAPSVRR